MERATHRAGIREAVRQGWPWVALALLALAVRLLPWRFAFPTSGPVLLVDSDPHYHVLRAIRILREFPRAPLVDPGLDFPYGARVLWPPLFDYLIAGPAWLLGGEPAEVLRVAAWLSPLLGAATVVLAARLGVRLLGRRAGLLAGFLLALLPAMVVLTIVGRPDQHAAELLLSTWVFGAFAGGLLPAGPGARSWGAPASMGLGLALSAWNWQGSSLYLLVPAVFVALWHVVASREESLRAARLLSRGSLAGAALLALSLAVLLPGELVRVSGKGVTGFHVLVQLAVAAFAFLLEQSARRRASAPPIRRVLEAAGAAALPGALLAVAGRAALATNLTALAASNAWYANIPEFWPLLVGGGWFPVERNVRHVLATFGLALFLLPATIPALRRRWARADDARASIAFLVAWGLVLVAMTLARRRLGEYAAVPVALWTAAALDDLGDRLGARAGGALAGRVVPWIGALALLAPALPTLVEAPRRVDPRGDVTPAMTWLSRAPVVPGREAVLGGWSHGHFIRYFSGRPVVTSPFGVDGGDRAMPDAARFYLARDGAAAEVVLAERRVGYVLLTHPGVEVQILSGFSEAGEPPPVTQEYDWRTGATHALQPSFWSLVPSRLFFQDGSGGRQAALGGFRLVFETPGSGGEDAPGDPESHKLFEVVPGAVLQVRGARPGATVVAAVRAVTNAGRRLTWRTGGVADASGAVDLRVPYATGRNGLVEAGPVRVTDGERARTVPVAESDVSSGARATVDLGDPARPPR